MTDIFSTWSYGQVALWVFGDWSLSIKRFPISKHQVQTPNDSMKRTSLPVTSFACAKESPATVGRLSWF